MFHHLPAWRFAPGQNREKRGSGLDGSGTGNFSGNMPHAPRLMTAGEEGYHAHHMPGAALHRVPHRTEAARTAASRKQTSAKQKAVCRKSKQLGERARGGCRGPSPAAGQGPGYDGRRMPADQRAVPGDGEKARGGGLLLLEATKAARCIPALGRYGARKPPAATAARKSPPLVYSMRILLTPYSPWSRSPSRARA